MLTDYIITCKRYDWTGVTSDPKEVNFFAGNSPNMTGAINLHDYGISASEISYGFDKTEETGIIITKYSEASDIRFQLSGIENNEYLKEYFMVFDDTTFVKFLIEISIPGEREPFFTGIVHQESIAEQFDSTPDSDIIELMAISLDKEFKEYYEDKKLKDPAEMNWPETVRIPQGSITPPVIKIKSIKPLFEEDIFNSPFIGFDMEPEVQKNKVVKECSFYKSTERALTQIGQTQFAKINFFRPGFKPKNQILYLASELQAAGLQAGIITQIAFKMNIEDPETGNNTATDLKISIKHTSLTTMTNFDLSEFTQVFFEATHIFTPGTQRWEIFTLDEQTPFNWNGSDNIIVEVCCFQKDTDQADVLSENGINGKWINKWFSGSGGGCDSTDGSDQGSRPALGISIGESAPIQDIWIKNSYTRAFKEDESRFNFMEKICEAMGWVYKFNNNKLIIKNRTAVDQPVKVIDGNNFIQWKAGKTREQVTYDTIVIADGEYTGGVKVNPWAESQPNGQNVLEAIYGKRIIVISQKYPDRLQMPIQWWEYVTGVTGQRYALVSHTDGFTFYRHWEDKERLISYKIFTWDNDNYKYDSEKFELKKYKILVIDGGENSSKRYKVECRYGGESEHEGSEGAGEYDLIYSSNYGNALVQVNTDGYLNRTYQDYIKTQQFKNNFAEFFSGVQNVTLEGTTDEVLTDPQFQIQILNIPELAGNWQITKLETDLDEETSTFELRKLIN